MLLTIFLISYLLNAIPAQEQLPVASIHVPFQDSEGYMWLGTRDGGLCRNDGYEIEVFGASDHVNSIAEDRFGHIVFGTHDGLYALDKKDYSVHVIDSALSGWDIDPVLIATDGTLWVGAGKTVRHYDPSWRLMASYASEWESKAVAPCRMTEDRNGRIWMVQWDGGIMQYNPQQDAFVPQKWPTDLQALNIVEDEQNDVYWVATWGDGIVRWNSTTGMVERLVCSSSDQLASQVIYLLRDPNHARLWASTMDGLRAYDIVNDRLQAVDVGVILPVGAGMTDYMTFDRTGNLWVGGFPPHSYVLSETNSDITKQRASHTIWNAAQEGDYLWFDEDRDLLCLRNLQTGQTTYGKEAGIEHFELIRNSKFRRCKTQAGIWTYADQTILHCWHEGMTIQAEPVVKTNGSIRCLFDDGEGGLYIGHADGIERYDLARKELASVSMADTTAVVQLMRYAIKENVRSFDIDRLGHWWTVTDRTVREYNPQNDNYRFFSASDPEIEMDYFCNVRAEEERVRVDGAGGVVYLHPMGDNNSKCTIHNAQLTSLIVNGEKRLVGLGLIIRLLFSMCRPQRGFYL